MLSFLWFFYFLTPWCLFSGFWWFICSLLFCFFFVYLLFFPYYLVGAGRGIFLAVIWSLMALFFLVFEFMCYDFGQWVYFLLGYFSGFFLWVVTVLTIMLYCTFRRIGLISFHIFFDSRLIPTLFFILGWGYQPEWVQARIYLLFYTLLASLPLLVGILFIYNSLGSFCLFLLCGGSSMIGGLFYICMVFTFLVKMPMWSDNKLRKLIAVKVIPHYLIPPWSPSKYSPWETIHWFQRLVHP